MSLLCHYPRSRASEQHSPLQRGGIARSDRHFHIGMPEQFLHGHDVRAVLCYALLRTQVGRWARFMSSSPALRQVFFNPSQFQPRPEIFEAVFGLRVVEDVLAIFHAVPCSNYVLGIVIQRNSSCFAVPPKPCRYVAIFVRMPNWIPYTPRPNSPARVQSAMLNTASGISGCRHLGSGQFPIVQRNRQANLRVHFPLAR